MITREYCVTMAQYNRWMNQKIYAASARLTDEERKRDLGAFFKSIHGTLNHLLWGDSVWFGRFVGEQLASGKTNAIIEDDFSALRNQRDNLDARILEWAQAVSPERLAASLRWTSAIDGKGLSKVVEASCDREREIAERGDDGISNQYTRD